MAGVQAPPLLKPLLPFLKHATQLDKHDKLMAYYCRMYAIQKGMELRNQQPNDENVKQFLNQIMDLLERDSQQITVDLEDEMYKRQYVENFGLKVFILAENEDMAGKANKNTARNFYAASIFLETSKQFGDLSEEIENKRKYAKWKAADITSCLRQGITPTPGPANSGEDPFGSEFGVDSSAGIPSFPGVPSSSSTFQTNNNINTTNFDNFNIPNNNNNNNNNNSGGGGGAAFSFPTVPSGENKAPSGYPEIPSQSNTSKMSSFSFPSPPTSTKETLGSGSGNPVFPLVPGSNINSSAPTSANRLSIFPSPPNSLQSSSSPASLFPSIPSSTGPPSGSLFPSVPSSSQSSGPASLFPSIPSGTAKTPPTSSSSSSSVFPSVPGASNASSLFPSTPPTFPSPPTSSGPKIGTTGSNSNPFLPSAFPSTPANPTNAPSNPSFPSNSNPPSNPSFPSNSANNAPSYPSFSNQTKKPVGGQQVLPTRDVGQANEPSYDDIQTAQKYARFAVSALQFDDIPYAIQNLRDALKLLTGKDS